MVDPPGESAPCGYLEAALAAMAAATPPPKLCEACDAMVVTEDGIEVSDCKLPPDFSLAGIRPDLAQAAGKVLQEYGGLGPRLDNEEAAYRRAVDRLFE